MLSSITLTILGGSRRIEPDATFLAEHTPIDTKRVRRARGWRHQGGLFVWSKLPCSLVDGVIHLLEGYAASLRLNARAAAIRVVDNRPA